MLMTLAVSMRTARLLLGEYLPSALALTARLLQRWLR